ncbi:MAG: hypothetical protein COA65_08015 [Rhodospirillaceae bacterium]|nr:MAG: hypothetical protein COA65_08015 [Rhodospirillaceae bacterium]
MQIDKASTQDAAGRVLSQGSVDGFWIFLVFGLLFFFPLSVGLVGSKINLSLYDVLLPLIFFFELVRGRIWWPGRKIVLLFLLPILAIGLHSVLTGVFLDGVHLTPLLIGTLRQVAFFADIGMLVLLFQLPERRCPSSGVLLALLFMAGAYALTMRNMEGHYADWAIHETIYAVIVTGLLLLFLFLQSREEKPANFLKPVAAIVWALVVIILLYTKFFILIVFLVAVLFFFSESLKFKERRLRRMLLLIGFSAALTALFVAALIQINLGTPFVAIYSHLDGSLWHSIDTRIRLWSFGWQLVVESFPWGTGLNQFGSHIAENSSLQALRLANVHNTPLHLLMELGALGVGIFGVVLAFIVLGGKKLNASWKASLCLCILMPMLLHDALGFRAAHVVLAFFLAGTFFSSAPTPFKAAPAVFQAGAAVRARESLR